MTAGLVHSSEELPIRPDTPWLAPLAGWSDLPFRLLCRELGASVCCTEMVSAKGFVYNSPGTKDLLDTSDGDTPLVLQLFGSEPAFMAEAASRLAERGFRWFDCNMGCSVHKVTRTGAGAALCRDTDNALAVAQTLIHTVGKGRVGFKIRLGWDETHSDTWRDLAKHLEEAGAGWITLHPRTAKQGFSGVARWECLRELKTLVRIPVIASGDLFTAQNGIQCLEQTGVDAVMYARGALRNPGIFAEHAALLRGEELPPPDSAGLKKRILHHAQLARDFSSEKTALLKMRTIVPRYVHALPGARALRLAVIACRDWETFYRTIEEHLSEDNLLLETNP